MKVLIVDDSKSIRMILKTMLKEYQFDVVEAEDGSQGLKCLKNDDTFSLVIVDLNMPVMNGIDFIKCVRSNPKFNDLTIMMLTTEAEVKTIGKALDAGANDYLLKPFTKENIVFKLDKLGIMTA